MSQASFVIWCTSLTVVLVGVALTTDLLWRRIPNVLTLPAVIVAVVIRFAFQGWAGLGLALGGAVLAPVLLLALHGGKGLGMGDLKLAAAIGAFVGPLLAVVAMFASAIAGGILAIVWMLRPGGLLADLLGTFVIGLPFWKNRDTQESSVASGSPAILTVPYGIAIGVGSLITVGLCLWTGHENWFLSFVGTAVNL